MSSAKYIEPKEVTQIPEPAVTRFLFADTRMAWLWLIVRLYVGYEWLTARLGKTDRLFHQHQQFRRSLQGRSPGLQRPRWISTINRRC